MGHLTYIERIFGMKRQTLRLMLATGLSAMVMTLTVGTALAGSVSAWAG